MNSGIVFKDSVKNIHNTKEGRPVTRLRYDFIFVVVVQVHTKIILKSVLIELRLSKLKEPLARLLIGEDSRCPLEMTHVIDEDNIHWHKSVYTTLHRMGVRLLQ